ncbi:MAG: glycoside hydrolase family 38 C-terminal domain-containing protein [Terrimicrobiaceae bacterium]
MKTLHLISQAHIDPVWLWPWADGAAEVLTTVQSAVYRAAEFPEFKFTRASAATYRWLKEMDPRLYAEVCRLIREGRWEVVGGWVEQPDCNLPSTESFVRQSLYGKSWLQAETGASITVGYNVDSFGHAGGFPQLLRRAGFTHYVFMRPDPMEAPEVPDLFWWESSDGSRVLTQRVPRQYSQSPKTTADELEKNLCDYWQAHFSPGFDEGIFFLGIGNHGGGPTREHLTRIMALRDDPALPRLRLSTLADYFAAVEKSPAIEAIPTWRGDLQYHARGCYAATGEVKQINRRAEKSLFTAESAQVAASLTGQSDLASPVLGEAWWRVLFNQFHDILAGSCIFSTLRPVRDAYGAACAEANELTVKAAFRIARKVDTTGEPGAVLFAWNPLPWPRRLLLQTDAFSDPHGRAPITHLQTRAGAKLPIQWMTPEAHFGPWLMPWQKLTAVVELPAHGYSVFRLASGDAPDPQPAPEPPFRVCNDALGLESWESADGVELLAAPLGLVVLEDQSDTWAHGVDGFVRELGRPRLVESRVVESGPLRTVYRQKGVWGSSEIWLDIVHNPACGTVELLIRLNWQEKRQLLKLDIPLSLGQSRVVCRSAGGVSARPFAGDEQPCHDWVALTGLAGGSARTVALLNGGSYSFSCLDANLRMIVVRSTPYAEYAPVIHTIGESGDFTTLSNERPLDEAIAPHTDQGWQERRFGLVERSGSDALGRLDREAEEFQLQPIVMIDSAHPGDLPWEQSLLRVEPATVAVLAVKPAENGKGFIVRMQEMSGCTAKAALSICGETPLKPVALKPWEIKTLRLCLTKKGWLVTSTDFLESEER